MSSRVMDDGYWRDVWMAKAEELERERDEARAEVERLTRRATDEEEVGKLVAEERDAERARADALEAALREIAANRYGAQGLTEDGASDAEFAAYYSGMMFEMQDRARDALARHGGKT